MTHAESVACEIQRTQQLHTLPTEITPYIRLSPNLLISRGMLKQHDNQRRLNDEYNNDPNRDGPYRQLSLERPTPHRRLIQ